MTAQLLRGARWAAIAAAGIACSVAIHLAAAEPSPDRLDAAVAIAPLLLLALVLAWRSPQRPLLLFWLSPSS